MSTDPSSQAVGGTVLSAAEIVKQRRLKMIVAGLGVAIALAFAGVVVGMIKRAGQIGKGQPAAASRTKPAPSEALEALSPQIRLALPEGSTVKSTALDGPRLAILYDSPSGQGLMILDLTSGAVLSRVLISSSTAR